MAFLAPLFFVGAVALAIPVLVHLAEKQRSNVVEFPSLMFLHKIPFRSVQKRRVRHWILLLMRALALLLLIAAFTRPFFEDGVVAGGSIIGPREVVILVDRSYSMGFGTRWDRARTAASEAVSGLRAGDRGSLVFFDRGAHAAVRSSSDPSRLAVALDSTAVSDQITRYGPGLKVAQSILDESDFPNREVVIVSDFQRNGWTGDEGVAFPTGTVVTTVPITDEATPNRSVAGVQLSRTMLAGRERIRVSVRLTREGGEEAEEVPVVLRLDGREIETRSVELGATGSVMVNFEPFTLTSAFTRGSVHLPPDALPKDDQAHFVLSPGRALSVLILEGGGARDEASLYLRRALEIGEASAFQVSVRSSTSFTETDLQRHAVVVLNDTRFPSGASGARLRSFVEGGGGLLVVLGERSAWRPEADDLLPGRFEAPRDGDRRGASRLGFLEYDHPIFELFSGARSGDFTRARFFRTRPLIPGPDDAVIARFDDGMPALVERRIGDGVVLLWGSTLDSFWNDLAVQPVFLPFVHALADHLAGQPDPAPWFDAGQVLDLADPDVLASVGPAEGLIPLTEDQVALAPGGGNVPLPATQGPRFLTLAEQGFYGIREPGSDDERPFSVAVNVDVSESELAPMDPDELAAAVMARDGLTTGGGLPGEVRPEDLERRQSLWRYLLMAALLLFVMETVVSNWLSRLATPKFGDGRGHAVG